MILEFFNVLLHRLQTLTWQSVILTAIAGLMAWIVYKVIEERLSPLRRIPSPPGRLPFIGHLLSLIKAGHFDYLIREWRSKCGPIMVFNCGLGIGIDSERVVVYDRNLIKEVLATQSHKFNRSKFAQGVIPGTRNGVFANNGKIHTRQRKMINPAFTLANLKTFVPKFEECTSKLIELWSQRIKESSIVEIDSDLRHLTLDIIAKTSFGFELNTVLKKETELSTALKSLLCAFELGYLVRSYLIPFYEYLPFPENLLIRRSLKTVNSNALQVIRERRMLLQQGKAADHKDLLSLLLDMYDDETGGGFKDEELRAQVVTFMQLGQDATSVSLSWALYELAKKPEIQDKIRQEMKENLKEDENLTWTKLNELEYLDCVVKETLRLHTPASVIDREANQTVVIGGYEIPKGTLIIIPIDAMHSSPDNWDKPDEFIPERFLEKENGSIDNYSFFPFSSGPRICIGYKFAMVKLKTVLVSLMKNFKFTAVPGFTVKSFMTLTTKPDPSVKVQISLLDNTN